MIGDCDEASVLSGVHAGSIGLVQDREAFCQECWRVWSPTWRFDEALFAATAWSFGNPDFVDTVIHSCRYRFGSVPGDPALEPLAKRLAEQPEITLPAVVLHGADDGVTPEAPGEVVRAIRSLL